MTRIIDERTSNHKCYRIDQIKHEGHRDVDHPSGENEHSAKHNVSLVNDRVGCDYLRNNAQYHLLYHPKHMFSGSPTCEWNGWTHHDRLRSDFQAQGVWEIGVYKNSGDDL